MVCKEDLCYWFKNLHPRKRIEYMCALLHMCQPLELRFVGTILEDYGKKDYHCLRTAEVAANKQAEVMKYRNISSPEMLRAKVSVTLALMRSSSTACAQIIYDIIESKLATVFSFGPGADGRVADEVLTLLTLAANHPAFMFEQKRRLHDHLCSLDTQKRDVSRDKPEEEVPLDLYPENHIAHYPAEEPSMPVHSPALCNRHSPLPQSRKVFVQNIEVRGPRKAAEKKVGLEYHITATWSNGEVTEVSKRFREIQEFHRQMMDLFPNEKPPNGSMPTLPAGSPHQHSSREEHISEQIRTLNAYFRCLLGVPSHILESDHLCQFLKGSVIRQAQPMPLIPPSMPYHQPQASLPDEDEAMNAVPPHLKSMTVRNSHLYYLAPQLNDPTNRIPRFMSPPHPHPHPFFIVPQRFQTGHACQTLLMPAHHIPLQQQQQQQQQQQHQQQQQQLTQQQSSPVSPPRSELSSANTSPTGSRSTSPDTSTTSVTQLLKLLGLEKYSNALGGLSFEQLSGLSSDELNKLGLPRDAQNILHSKLDQINSEKPVLINGMMDNNLAFPSFGMASPSSPSSSAWLPVTSFRAAVPASPRLTVGALDSSAGLLSDVASGGGGSPPVSPGPGKLLGGPQGKGLPGDSSEGSEDLDKDKSEHLLDVGNKSAAHQQGKSVQVKVSSGGGGGGGASGGSSSPRPPSTNSRMTPPDEAAAKGVLPHMQHAMPPMIPYYFQPSALPPGPAPPGLLGQYMDPKAADMGMMGVVHNASNNANNNYTTEAIPVMPAGLPHRPGLLQAGVGAGAVRPPFKAGQPQPAHTNMSVLHGKNLISMPAEPKPGSPVIPFVQSAMGQGMGSSGPPMEGGAHQRMPLYPVPYGRNQGGPIVTGHLPPVLPSQPGVFSFPLVTRSMQSTQPGSTSVMTVSASHPVTVVTASHPTSATTTSILRSPSHGNGASNGNGQRDSGNESVGGGGGGGMVTEGSLRSSPLQVGGGGVTVTQVAAAPSPPASHYAGCQVCAQGSHYTSGQYGQVPYYQPFFLPQGHNGLMPVPAMSGYYSSNQPMASGVLTNGYTSDMYPYTHPGYPTLNPGGGHIYPMMHGNTVYQGNPSQAGLAAAAAGNGLPMVPPQAPSAAGGLGGGGQLGGGVAVKQRNTGCYNCGSLAHKAADCPESSMETMSGKSVYTLDFKPQEESD